jgi:hypothetical protein
VLSKQEPHDLIFKIRDSVCESKHLAPTFPHIDLISNPHQIQASWMLGDTDVRYDMRIHNALKLAGVLIE